LRCTRSSNRLTLTTTRWWVPSPIVSTVSRFHVKSDGASLYPHDFGGGDDQQADRACGHVTDVEMDTEALVTRRKKVLDRVECRGLDQIDHDRGRKDRNASGAHERRGMFRPNDKLRRSLQAKIDVPQMDHAASGL